MQHPFKLKSWLERQVLEIKQVNNKTPSHGFVTWQLPVCASYCVCTLGFEILPVNNYFEEENIRSLSFIQAKTENLGK